MRHYNRLGLLGCLLLSLLGWSSWSNDTYTDQARLPQTATTSASAMQGEAAVQHLKQQGQYESLQKALQQARYKVSRVMHTPLGRAAWHAPNQANGYDGYVTEDGISIALNDRSYLSLTLRGIGYGRGLHYVGSGQVTGDQNNIRIQRDGKIKEWYANRESGIEQGFTLAEPPSGQPQQGEKLRLVFGLNQGWYARAKDNGHSVTLRHQETGEAVDYTKLVVWDVRGSILPSALLVDDGRVVIEVEDATATYPLTIDPTFILQAQLTANDGASGDEFGNSVALSGNTVVIGAPADDGGRGSAYVFVRSGATWTQQAKLIASDGAVNDRFGASVAISGDTILVGAGFDDLGASNLDQGSAYIFARSGSLWTQQAKLIASDGAGGDQFGLSVAISDNTAVIGAAQDEEGAMGDDVGAAYIFTRSGTTWSQQQKLIASDGQAGDNFGASVAISGESVIFGAPHASNGLGAGYVFIRSGSVWSQQQKLNASDGMAGDLFGSSVGISGNNAIVGASGDDNGVNMDQGAAYIFIRSGNTWSQHFRLFDALGSGNDRFGSSVGINGDAAIVGAPGWNTTGQAYVFTRNGTVWNQVHQLEPVNSAAGDNFGYSVALSGDTAVVGAKGDDVASNLDQGSVFLYPQPKLPVRAQTLLVPTPPLGLNDRNGVSVAISGDTLVMGADRDDVGANVDQGSAYVFVRNGSTWTQQAQLNAMDGAASDGFGISVAISGDTVVVGAHLDDVGASADQGSAYVFVRSGTTWTQQAKLNAEGGAANDRFGNSVAISGDSVVIGAQEDNIGLIADQGSAYVFVRSGASWTQQAQLNAMDGAADDRFGYSVSISGDSVVVGAYLNDVGANANQGSAYVFARSGTAWTQQTMLLAANGVTNAYFGVSVAISGETAVIGASSVDLAYVFVRNGTTWTQQAQLTPVTIGGFGFSVAISGDLIAVGVPGYNNETGMACLFERSGTTWNRQPIYNSLIGDYFVNFGYSVAIDGDYMACGVPYVLNTVGAAYVFEPCRYEITPTTQTFSAAGGRSSFNIACQSTCQRTHVSSVPWITVEASGTGTGTVNFTVAPNSGLPRTGSISVSGGLSFSITQDGACSLTLAPSGLPAGIVNAAYTQTLTASGGNGTYSFQLANATTLPPGLSLSNGGVLSGTPTAGSQGNYTFTIAATDTNGCAGALTYTMTIDMCPVTSLSPTSQSVPGAGGSFNFSVTAPGCAWTTLKPSWINITANATGTGNLVVAYSVAANPGPARTGLITVNNQTFTVNQAVGDPNGDVDNDGIPNGVEYSEGTNPELKDNDIFTNNRLFVMQQYRDFLGREGDVAGIQAWVDLLANNSQTRAQVIQSFFNSPEFQQYGAPIVRLYLAYFQRIPDYSGQIGWTNSLRNGTSINTISQSFATSPEFIQTYGSLNNTQFVTLVYQNVLNRTPSPSEINAWVTLLNQGASRGEVMTGFSESAEFKLQSANKVFVVMMYVGMLRRTPEQAGYDGWVALLNGGTSQLVLTQSFLDAPEYRLRFMP